MKNYVSQNKHFEWDTLVFTVKIKSELFYNSSEFVPMKFEFEKLTVNAKIQKVIEKSAFISLRIIPKSVEDKSSYLLTLKKYEDSSLPADNFLGYLQPNKEKEIVIDSSEFSSGDEILFPFIIF